MPNFFYTDASGQRRGPITDQQLRTFAAQGLITPQTPLETDTGPKGVAGQVPGLFPTATPFQSPVPTPGNKVPPWAIAVGVVLLLVVGVVAGSMITSGSGDQATKPGKVQFTVAEQAEIDRFLGEYGNDPKAVDKDGNTMLHHAAEYGTPAVIKYLISQGVSVHVRNQYNRCTPLHYAAYKWNLKIVEFLISQGVDVNAKEVINDETAFDYAKSKQNRAGNNMAVIEHLESIGAKSGK